MTNVTQAVRGVVKEPFLKPTKYSFVYAYTAETGKWRGTPWKHVKKEFDTVEQAVHAAGLWMQVCHDHGCPIAVAIEER